MKAVENAFDFSTGTELSCQRISDNNKITSLLSLGPAQEIRNVWPAKKEIKSTQK